MTACWSFSRCSSALSGFHFHYKAHIIDVMTNRQIRVTYMAIKCGWSTALHIHTHTHTHTHTVDKYELFGKLHRVLKYATSADGLLAVVAPWLKSKR